MKNEINVVTNLLIKGMDVIKRVYSGGGGDRSYTQHHARRVKRT